MFLQHGGSGKTSLLHSINMTIRNKKIKELPTPEFTIGIDISHLGLINNKKIQYKAYNFAGTFLYFFSHFSLRTT